MTEQIKIALLVSRQTTSAKSVIQKYQQGVFEKIKPVLIISSNPQSEILPIAEKSGIKTEVIQRSNCKSDIDFGHKLLKTLKQERVDLIAQLGWSSKTPFGVIAEYKNYIFNQFSAPLDPGRQDFGGVGMYGNRAVLAVLLYNCFSGESIPTEATTHLVTKYYNDGEIISRKELKFTNPFGIFTREQIMSRKKYQEYVMAKAHQFKEELGPIECDNVISTLKSYQDGQPKIYKREKPLVPQDKLVYLSKAKKLAIDLGNKIKQYNTTQPIPDSFILE